MKYWLRVPELAWQAVTRDKFVEMERRAGFYPKTGCGIATAGFGTDTIEGKITGGEHGKKSQRSNS